jgi:geranylgeranyl pyrophosphate synthase
LKEEFHAFAENVRTSVETFLSELFAGYARTEVCRVARYVTLGGGHRWRPMAVISAGKIFREDAFDVCLSSACAVEIVHAATLLLDDLPSMDDAQIRRGKACAHLVFPEWAVAMTPAFLVNSAHEIILDNPRTTHERRILASLVCSRAGRNMASGQELDLSELRSNMEDDQILECYRLKSGVLYAACTKAGGLICGADPDEADLLHHCGMKLGLAYQLFDDVADVEVGIDEVGKQSGMDAEKKTAIDLFGVEGAKRRARQFQEEAIESLSCFGPEAALLRELVLRAAGPAV